MANCKDASTQECIESDTVPFTGISGRVLKVTVAVNPSPSRVTPARLMLYFVPGVKFSRWCEVSEADMLWHLPEITWDVGSFSFLSWVSKVVYSCWILYICNNTRSYTWQNMHFSHKVYKTVGFVRKTKGYRWVIKSDVHTFLLVLWADLHTAKYVVCEEPSLVHKGNCFPRQFSRIVCFVKRNKVLGCSVWNLRG